MKTRAADALHRRIQAPAGGAGGEDHAAQFRPRPALSDHKRLSRQVMTNDDRQSDRRAIRAVAHRAHAYRQCPHGDAQLAVRAEAKRPFILRYRRHRRRALEAGVRARHRSRTWHGSASPRTAIERQSKRFDALLPSRRAAQGRRGRLYPCYETPEELEGGASGSWPRRCRRSTTAPRLTLTRGRSPAARKRRAAAALAVQARAPQGGLGRPHPRRRSRSTPRRCPIRCWCARDGSYLYTLPSVVDDIDFGITHVIRGEDHVVNTAVQIEIFEALGGQAAAIRASQPAHRGRRQGAVEAARLAVDRRHARERD